MWVWLVKVFVLLVLFLLTLVFSLLPFPIVSASKRRSQRYQDVFKSAISILTVFSAGVFLGTCLLDLLPEMRRKLMGALEGTPTYGFPVAEFVMSFGFFLILVTEQLVLACKESAEIEHTGVTRAFSQRSLARSSVAVRVDDGNGAGDRSDSERCRPSSTAVAAARRLKSVMQSVMQPNERTALLDAGVGGRIESDGPLEGPVSNGFGPDTAHILTPTNDDEPDIDEELLGYTGIRPRSQSALSTASSLNNAFTDLPGGGDITDKSLHVDANSHSVVRSFMMLIALSLHSVFEGLAIGLQGTVADTLSIFGAVIIHKCVLAFSLGLTLVNAGLSTRKAILSNLGFCAASPFGTAIGILVDSVSSAGTLGLVSGTLQGLACGTFLYVTFFEVLPHEFSHSGNRVLKLVFLILGFSLIVGLVFMEQILSPEG